MILGHRGSPKTAPENTLPSLLAAIAEGADGVEVDVRLDGSGRPVLWHDAEVFVDGEIRRIVDLAPDELSRADIAATLAARPPWAGGTRPGEAIAGEAIAGEAIEGAAIDEASIATLDEALDAMRGQRIDIELKGLPGEPDVDEEHRIAETVVRSLTPGQNALVSSFWTDALDRVGELSDVPLGWILIPGSPGLELATIALERGYEYLIVHESSLFLPGSAELRDETEAAIEWASEYLRILVWTVNEPARIRRLAAFGVDGIITDVPAVARRSLPASTAPN